jgi:hypothetical protein
LSIPGGHAEGPASQHTSLQRGDGATLETCHCVWWHVANKRGHRAANTSRQEGLKSLSLGVLSAYASVCCHVAAWCLHRSIDKIR